MNWRLIMDYDLILIRYGELALKSDKVRRRFEKKLVKNIQASIEGEVKRDQGRIYIEPVNFDDAISRLDKIFGIVSYSPVKKTKTSKEDISNTLHEYTQNLIDEGFLNENVFKFVSGIFLNLMGTFAGILVFLSVISGICGMGNLSDFTKMGKYMVKRFIVFSFVGGATCGLIMIPFFSFQFGATTGKDQASAILNLLKDIIPSNPITPFQDGNMLQIVIMAVIVGGIILLMSREVDGIRDLIFQAKSISLRLMESICKLLPIFIISSLTSMFWENGMGIFATIWKPLVFIVASCYGLMIIKLIVTSVRCKVPALLLFKKVLPGFVIGFTTASSTAALGTVFDINSKKLGIMDNINRFGVPVSNIVCNSATSASFIAIIYYLTEYSGNPVDASWFLSAWFIVTLMAFAMPPVSGGTLVVLGVLFAQFGLPSSTLGLAGILALLADFISTSSKIVIGQMELVLEAAHWMSISYAVISDAIYPCGNDYRCTRIRESKKARLLATSGLW